MALARGDSAATWSGSGWTGAATLPEAAALDRTIGATEKLDRILAETPGVVSRLIVNGYNVLRRGRRPATAAQPSAG